MSFHSGLAASNGVKAARLAKRGFTADTHIFDGPMNIGQVFSKEWSDTALWSDLEKWGEPFVIIHPGQTFKLYPCGRPPLFAIDCVVELQKKHQLKLNDIKKITCDVSYMYPRTLIHSRPINGLQAKTSLEYCIASALLDKRPSLVSFSDEAVKRPEIAKLIDLIEVRVPPHLSDEVESVRKAPFEQPVTLTIENKAKKIFIETTAFHKGSPENPASQSDLDQKFKDCLSPWISQARIPQILELCKNTSTPMKVLMRKLCI
jgi:2-methylcitrate dehydratase PrpD